MQISGSNKGRGDYKDEKELNITDVSWFFHYEENLVQIFKKFELRKTREGVLTWKNARFTRQGAKQRA